jgi:hypothetical protein
MFITHIPRKVASEQSPYGTFGITGVHLSKGSLLLFDTLEHGTEIFCVCLSRQYVVSFRIFYIYDLKFSISDETFDLCSDVLVDIALIATHCVVSNSVS